MERQFPRYKLRAKHTEAIQVQSACSSIEFEESDCQQPACGKANKLVASTVNLFVVSVLGGVSFYGMLTRVLSVRSLGGKFSGPFHPDDVL